MTGFPPRRAGAAGTYPGSGRTADPNLRGIVLSTVSQRVGGDFERIVGNPEVMYLSVWPPIQTGTSSRSQGAPGVEDESGRGK
jgi:hypothetical protein